MLRTFGYMLLTCLLLVACSKDDKDSKQTTNQSKPPALKMANFNEKAWLRQVLPANVVGYFRLPTLAYLYDNVDNGFKYAQGNEAHVNLLKQMQQGFYDNLLSKVEPAERPIYNLLVKHINAPLEIAVLMNEENPTAPTVLIATNLDTKDNAEFSQLLSGLMANQPMISETQPINAQGIGALSIAPMAVNAVYRFDNKTGQLTMAVSNMLAQTQLESRIASLTATETHSMFAAEKQIDESGKGLFAFVDVKAILPKIDMMLPPEAKAGLQMSGMDKVNSFALGYGASQSKTRLKLLIDMPAVGFRAYLPSVSNNFDFSARGEIDSVGVLSLPTEVQYKRIEATISMMKGRAPEYNEFKQKFKTETGFEVEQILSIVGPEMVYFSDSVSDFIAMRLQDKTKFQQLLKTGQDKGVVNYSTRQVNGTTIHHATTDFMSFDDESMQSLDMQPAVQYMLQQIKSHYYWIEEDNFLVFSAVPQPLIERASRNDKVNLKSWLKDNQKHSLESAFLAFSASKEGISRKSYYFYLQLLNALVDISGSQADIYSLPHAGQLNFAEKGSMGFSIDLDEKFIALEFNFEQSLFDIFYAGGYESIAVIGILAAVALPAYQDYTVRTQVSTALISASPIKTQITELVLTGTPVAQINNGSHQLLSAADYAGSYVDYIEVKNGVINIGVGSQNANQAIQGGVLKLTPQIGANQMINWSCIAIDIEDKFLPQECRQQ